MRSGTYWFGEGGTGDPVMGDRPLLYLKSVTISRSLSLCQFSHPSQGSLLSGSLVPRSWLERAFQQPLPSLKLARILDEPAARPFKAFDK
ncbi:hypothetical protein [Dictyobacter formicarum]|uniref:hypothetical protein n=1 Tax=Dictyobacter formicarum TaxID=2778368 RepID=UPI00191529E3|nr:hypothetical protein [Dictyobacter formicarum]